MRSGHDAAAERTRSGGDAELPQTPQNVTQVATSAWYLCVEWHLCVK